MKQNRMQQEVQQVKREQPRQEEASAATVNPTIHEETDEINESEPENSIEDEAVFFGAKQYEAAFH